MKICILFILALAACTPIAKPSPSPPQPFPAAARSVGLNAHGLRDQDIDIIRELGVKDVRHTLYWHIWETDADYRAWFPETLRKANEAGLRILLVVWGTDPAGQDEHSLSRFVDWFAQVIPLLPPVHAIQPWNEIDGDHWTAVFKASSLKERGNLYGRHLNDLRSRVPHTYVSAGIDGHSATQFWEGMREVGAVPDAFAIHVYAPPFNVTLPGFWEVVGPAAGGVPIWLTEFGISVHLSSEEAQRTAWQEVEKHSQHRFARIYGYALWTDEEGVRGNGIEQHGILRPDGTQRPAAVWLKEHHDKLPATPDK
jgi:hypothetical protein